jgi:DNA-binding MarR family transcriptional regulator
MAVDRSTAADLVHTIFDLQRTLRCATASSARPTDLGLALEGVLRFVGEGGRSRASDIAGRLGIGPSALSRQVAELEEHGMLLRQPDPADGRAHLLSLSIEGEAYLREVEGRRAAAVQDMLSGWSEEEACATDRTLEHLTAALRSAINRNSRPRTGTTQDQKSATLSGVN